MASDLLRKISSEIDGRLAEVRPFVLEYERLKEAVETLATVDGSRAADSAVRDGAVRPPAKPARRRVPRSAQGAIKPAASRPSRRSAAPREKPRAKARSAAAQAVLDALDHGSHTVSELVMVTAISASEIRSGVRRLLGDAAIVKVGRDGKTAYALAPRGGTSGG